MAAVWVDKPMRSPQSIKNVRYAAYALIALSLVAPFTLGALGYGRALDAALRLGQWIVWLVISSVISYLATMGRSEWAKACARVLVGVTMIVVVAPGIVYSAARKTEEQVFLREALQIRDEFVERSADVDARLAAINIEYLLTPESITSEQGRSNARTKLAEYSALLVERKKSITTFYDTQQRFFEMRSPTDADRDAALATMARNRPQVEWIYRG